MWQRVQNAVKGEREENTPRDREVGAGKGRDAEATAEIMADAWVARSSAAAKRLCSPLLISHTHDIQCHPQWAKETDHKPAVALHPPSLMTFAVFFLLELCLIRVGLFTSLSPTNIYHLCWCLHFFPFFYFKEFKIVFQEYLSNFLLFLKSRTLP